MFNMKNTQHLDYLDALSTQELEALIQDDWQQESADNSETISRALAILEERGALACDCVDVDAAWQEFQTRYNIPEGENASLYPGRLPADRAAAGKRRSRSILKALSAAAAVFALVLFMAMPVFGSESLFRLFGQWTESMFTFSDEQGNAGDPPKMDEYRTDNPGLMTVYKEILAQGDYDHVVPAWLPEGFSLSELSTTPMPRYTKVVAAFSKDEKTLTIVYLIYGGNVSSDFLSEKGDGEVKMVEIAGVDHYFFQNNDQWLCCWVRNNIECSIGGDISENDLQKVIQSIYSEVEESEKNN